MVLKSNHCYQKKTNEKLGVATEPSPESLICIGGLCICAVGHDILKFEQTTLFYSVSYFSLEGLGALFWMGKAPTWRRDCVAKLQLAYKCNGLTLKST